MQIRPIKNKERKSKDTSSQNQGNSVDGWELEEGQDLSVLTIGILNSISSFYLQNSNPLYNLTTYMVRYSRTDMGVKVIKKE